MAKNCAGVHISRGSRNNGCVVGCGCTQEWCDGGCSQEWVEQVGGGEGGVKGDDGGVETSGRWPI